MNKIKDWKGFSFPPLFVLFSPKKQAFACYVIKIANANQLPIFEPRTWFDPLKQPPVIISAQDYFFSF
ncbi:hypothetical protein C0585_05075 [Candidatus Woesearchaeota archaeon]|nr:MAG: hypothetical protein C0585_05075 [Candidatus Woesearchaeota archaeon]